MMFWLSISGIGTYHLHKHALTGQQHISIFLPCPALIRYRDSPLASIVHPPSFFHLVAELDVSIEIPFPGDSMDILMDLFAAGIESRPVGIWVEGEGLLMSMDGALMPNEIEGVVVHKYETVHRTARPDRY